MFKKQCRESSAHFGVIYNLYSAFCLTHTYMQRRHGAFKFTSHIYKSLLQNNKGCVKLSLLFCSLTAAFQMLKSLQYPINFYIDRSLKTLKIVVSKHDRILVLANTLYLYLGPVFEWTQNKSNQDQENRFATTSVTHPRHRPYSFNRCIVGNVGTRFWHGGRTCVNW